MNVFDKESKTFKRYQLKDSVGLGSDQIHSLYEDSNGIMWIGTRSGLSKYNEASDTFSNFLMDENNEKTLSNDWVLSLASAGEDALWVGTNGGGVNKFNTITGEVERHSQKEGIPHGEIQSILIAESGDVWMSASIGLIRYDTKSDKYYIYDVSDGLQGYSFYLNCAFQSEEGYMYFGGSKGFNRFIPSEIEPNSFVPPVYISSLDLYGNPISPNKNPDLLNSVISQTKDLELSYKDDFLRFKFEALNYRNAFKNRYAYKLEPLQKEWVYTSADRRDATYTSLNPGKYIFKVKASNNDGIWNETPTELNITIRPPWWETPLARILFAVVLIGLTYLFYRRRTANLRRKKEELEKLVEERTNDLKGANLDLQSKNEEIVVQNEELHQQAEEISAQRDKIEAQHQDLEAAYKDISIVSEVGKDITGSLSLNRIFEEVYKDVNLLMDAPTFAIGVYNEETNNLDFVEIDGEGKSVSSSKDSLNQEDMLSVQAFKESKSIVVGNFDQEFPDQKSDSQSIMYLPLNSKGKKIGVITVQSPTANAYNERHLTILETLASYAATALDNSIAYEIINTKNKMITDSIRYAQTIQEAILPTETKLQSAFKDHFVLFKPKDIVSGDFYWHTSVKNEETGSDLHYVATVDCTGHGVPGAFMSMIGARVLNEVVIEKGHRSPAEILELMNESVIIALKQDSSNKYANMDGMDLSLCVLEKTDENHTKVVFAGAKSAIYIHRESSNEIERISGDKRAIGGLQRRTKPFQDFEIHLTKDDALYLITDGFMDQNGTTHKKFGRNQFLELLQKCADMPMQSQKELFETALMRHQENAEQRDDITLLGIRI